MEAPLKPTLLVSQPQDVLLIIAQYAGEPLAFRLICKRFSQITNLWFRSLNLELRREFPNFRIVPEEALAEFKNLIRQLREQLRYYNFSNADKVGTDLPWTFKNLRTLVKGVKKEVLHKRRQSLAALVDHVYIDLHNQVPPLVDFSSFLPILCRWKSLRALPQFNSITKLSLRGFHVYEIPSQFQQLTALRNLELIDSFVIDIPDLPNLSRLQTLGLENNCYLNNIPFYCMKQLIVLNIARCPKLFKSLKSIHRLTTLRQLTLTRNTLQSTEFLTKSTNLTTLEMDEPETNLCLLSKMDFLRTLILKSATNSMELSNVICSLTNLENLELSKNEINNLQGVNALTNLTTLNVNQTPPMSLTLSIQDLTNLTNLKLKLAQFKETPEHLDSLLHLRTLDLEGNSLENLPKKLSVLTNLTVLDISHNDFKQFPEVITSFTRLRILCLDNNEITCIPGELADFPHLNLLSLKSNRISRLPRALRIRAFLEIHSRDQRVNSLCQLM